MSFINSQPSDDSIVSTDRTGAAEVTTVIITADGATSHPCPGGLTEGDLVD
ncbi:MAG: hypothetical protein H0W29_08325 [Gemmatimonadales bacterium]|jgi:hypothetical protein|nr:hypothetical protein [Gemmatimonadales bacterium]